MMNRTNFLISVINNEIQIGKRTLTESCLKVGESSIVHFLAKINTSINLNKLIFEKITKYISVNFPINF